MNEFDTLDELFLHAIEECSQDLVGIDSRDGPVARETLGFNARLRNPASNFIFNPRRKMSPHYAAAEFLWYMSGDLSIQRILPYAPQYERFANRLSILRDPETGKESNDPMHPRFVELCAPGAAYGHRMQKKSYEGFTQITHVIRTLIKDPESRQAVLGIWDPNLDPGYVEQGDIKTIPCTLSLQFLIRSGRLNCICTMRSNDVWLGIPNDIFCFTCLQQLIAEVLDIPVGWYQHQVGSLHIYRRDWQKCLEAQEVSFNADTGIRYPQRAAASSFRLSEVLEKAVDMEEKIRVEGGTWRSALEAYFQNHSLLHDIVCMAGSKWEPSLASDIEWKSLRKYTEAFVNADS